tara:strand:+ start:160 stop:609 length:450 start_codon:yes stop_codon:yes gene_type:complete
VIGALFKKTNKRNIINPAIIIPLTLRNAFLGLVIFLILSPLYTRFVTPQITKGRIIEIYPFISEVSTKLKITKRKQNVLSLKSLKILNATEKITAATTGITPSKKEEKPGIFFEFRYRCEKITIIIKDGNRTAINETTAPFQPFIINPI